MKKLGAVLAALIIIFTALPGASGAEPALSARQAVLYDAGSGRVLYGKKENDTGLIASTTKVMTALVVLENCALNESVIVDSRSAGAEGSSIYIKAGEVLTVETLLYGLMLESGNDAAMALALHAAGSTEKFAAMMNAKAAELKMENTSFANPSGMDAEEHYSTPLDMAILMAAAMENEAFAKITGTSSITMQGRSFYNHNKLLSMYPEVDGGKTGFTKAAGRTLLSTAVIDGHRLVAVTFGAPNDWNDHKSLYSWAREAFLWIDITSSMPELPVVGALQEWVTPVSGGEICLPVKSDDEAELVFYLPHILFAPVEAGQCLGYAVLETEGREEAKMPLYCPVHIESIDILPWHRKLYFGENQ